MKLSVLLENVKYKILSANEAIEDIEVSKPVYDSRKVDTDSVFICITGEKADGHLFIKDAWDRGNRIFVVEKEPEKYPESGTFIKVDSTRKALAHMSAAYWGYPSRKLKMIGVTGTKGKTTFTALMAEALKRNGKKTATIGTLGIQIDGEWFPQENTTPESFTIHRYFDKMVRAGCEYVVMEVSSQGLSQMRVEGIRFDVAVFTNLGVDHIGPLEHADFEEYRYWKSRLFHQCRTAVVNMDDRQSVYMLQNTDCEKYGYSCLSEPLFDCRDGQHWICAENIQYESENDKGTTFKIENKIFRMKMPGMYNVYNALSVISVGRILGLSEQVVREVLENAHVDGRMERVKTRKNINCYVDYAHNAMSLENVLRTVRTYHPTEVIVVFGCGGERSRERRILMGETAGNHADLTVVTTDNPRNEDPQQIIVDIVEGIDRTGGQFLIEPDRAEAVKKAMELAPEGAVVLVAGKGHERFQERNGKRYAMDDRQLIKEADQKIESRD